MQAIVVRSYGDASSLRLEEVDLPEPGFGEVRIRIEAAGVNFVDIYYRTGRYPSALPLIPGMEAAGVVDAVGDGESALSPGDTVAFAMCLGAYSEYIVLPASRVVTVPHELSSSTAAASLLQGMTAQFLSRDLCPASPGESVLVHAGAGGLGQLLIQFLHHRGLRVLATASTAKKLEVAAQAGADEVIDYVRDDFVAAVRKLTGGEGVSVVYDSVGKTTWEGSFDSVRSRGLVVFCGQSSGFVPPIDPQLLRVKGSIVMARPSLTDYIANRAELIQRSREVFGALRDGTLRVNIEEQFPLAEAPAAHRRLESRSATGKILLLP